VKGTTFKPYGIPVDFASNEATKMNSRFSINPGSKLKKLVSMSALAAVLGILPQIGMSQNLVTAEWFTLGGDYAHTRYTPADEITAENFDEFEVAWEWYRLASTAAPRLLM